MMMITPNEFLPRVLATVDELALRLSHIPRGEQEQFIKGFADRVRAQWREVFAPYLTAADVDGMVHDMVARVRAKRDGLEKLACGTA